MVKRARSLFGKKYIRRIDDPAADIKAAVDQLEAICIEQFNYDYGDIIQECRDQDLVMIRHAWTILLNSYFNFTHEMIADILKRERSTLSKNIKTASELYDTKFEPFMRKYNVILEQLKKQRHA